MTDDGGFSFWPADDGIDGSDRRNWDMPYLMSPHDNEVLYTGTYRVYRGDGFYPFWFPISEDLTDGEEEPHRYHNITAIDESKLQEGLLYVGTGDGNLWRSDNFGGNWISISAGLPDQYVTDVVASPNEVDVVYVTYSGYRDNDFLPRIHRSENRGDDWIDISADLPDLAINELLVLPDFVDSILFVATDGGVYGTTDAATTWHRLGTNMPIITVYDLALNEANNELVAGTFARSIMSYSLDSVNTTPDIMIAAEEPFQLNNTLKVTPTLAHEKVLIELGNIEINRTFEIVVVDAGGRLMVREKGQGQGGQFTLDVSGWAVGPYFVKAKMRHEVVNAKFSVMR